MFGGMQGGILNHVQIDIIGVIAVAVVIVLVLKNIEVKVVVLAVIFFSDFFLCFNAYHCRCCFFCNGLNILAQKENALHLILI